MGQKKKRKRERGSECAAGCAGQGRRARPAIIAVGEKKR